MAFRFRRGFKTEAEGQVEKKITDVHRDCTSNGRPMGLSKTPSQIYSVDERVQMWEDRLRLCHYCDKKVAKPGTYSGKKTTFDHIVARSKGGSDSVDNLVLCCARCNSEKGKKDYLDFLIDRRKQAATQVNRLNQLIVAFYSKQV